MIQLGEPTAEFYPRVTFQKQTTRTMPTENGEPWEPRSLQIEKANSTLI